MSRQHANECEALSGKRYENSATWLWGYDWTYDLLYSTCTATDGDCKTLDIRRQHRRCRSGHRRCAGIRASRSRSPRARRGARLVRLADLVLVQGGLAHHPVVRDVVGQGTLVQVEPGAAVDHGDLQIRPAAGRPPVHVVVVRSGLPRPAEFRLAGLGACGEVADAGA